MMTGLTVMIHSFRSSVSAWIDGGIVADLFIAPASNEVIGLNATVPEEALLWLRKQPDVASVDTFREQPITIVNSDGRTGRALLAVVGGIYRDNLQFSEGEGTRVFREAAVAVTESFARRWKVHAGESLTLATPAGPREFPIAGVYADYSRDQGTVLIARPTFDRYWTQPGVNSLAVYLPEGVKANALADRFRAEFSRQGEFAIYSNRTLRERILTIFDQTFAVTAMLRVIAIVVALLGIFLSVTALVTERERETGDVAGGRRFPRADRTPLHGGVGAHGFDRRCVGDGCGCDPCSRSDEGGESRVLWMDDSSLLAVVESARCAVLDRGHGCRGCMVSCGTRRPRQHCANQSAKNETPPSTLHPVTAVVAPVLASLAPRRIPWRLSLPGWEYAFPRDHGPHRDFKTEWWYFTGRLAERRGPAVRISAYVFSAGSSPPSIGEHGHLPVPHKDLPFGHFAFTDVEKRAVHLCAAAFPRSLRRGWFRRADTIRSTAAGLAQRLVARDDPGEEFMLNAKHDGVTLKLRLRAAKPWVLHGKAGVSQKAAGEGRASHYYSGTRLTTEGSVILDGLEVPVKGESWFDHEWASNQLTPGTDRVELVQPHLERWHGADALPDAAPRRRSGSAFQRHVRGCGRGKPATLRSATTSLLRCVIGRVRRTGGRVSD